MCFLVVSLDGNWLVVLGISVGVYVYNVKQLKFYCMVFVYNFLVIVMVIVFNINNFVIVYLDQQVFEYSILDKQYIDWSWIVQKQGFYYFWF